MSSKDSLGSEQSFPGRFFDDDRRPPLLQSNRAKTFEEEALKYVQSGDTDALKEFLFNKLDSLQDKEVTQITLVTMWLLEILLEALAKMRVANETSSDKYKLATAEFRSLVTEKKVQSCLFQNKSKVLELIASHGDEENMLFAAKELKDMKCVLQFLIQRKKYDEAFVVLRKEKNSDLIYEFAPILMSASPVKMVSLLIEKGRRLDPTRIVPTLLQLPNTQAKLEVTRYLDYCLNSLKIEDKVLSNYLLAMYTSLDIQKLEEFLDNSQDDEDVEINYDPKFILRLCHENDQLKAASVLLYTKLGLLEDAVDLALRFGHVSLAKKITERVSDEDDQLKRKLWLKVAESVVSQEEDMSKITEFLKETKNVLQIADILPFFPDFVSIDHFKDAICKSLEEYNSTISDLKEEMKDAADNLTEIKNEVEELRRRHTVIRTSNICDLCEDPILMSAFHAFPCHHLFHAKCLVIAMQGHLKGHQMKRLKDIQRILDSDAAIGAASAPGFQAAATSSSMMTSLASGMATTASKFGSRSIPATQQLDEVTKEKLIAEMNDLIASECLFCGELMIESIDQPLFNQDQGQFSDSWN